MNVAKPLFPKLVLFCSLEKMMVPSGNKGTIRNYPPKLSDERLCHSGLTILTFGAISSVPYSVRETTFNLQ
jgi:hypothetical protein